MGKLPEPKWVPAFAAFNAVRGHYKEHSHYDDECCWNAANDVLMRRLRMGQLPARALKIDYESEIFNIPDGFVPFDRSMGEYEPVPIEFWDSLFDSFRLAWKVDWFSGDFYSESAITKEESDEVLAVLRSQVIGLEIDANFLPHDLASNSPWAATAAGASTQARNKGGRPPAADWEAAALEMAGLYYRGSLKPERIADVKNRLASWLSDQDSEPSPSVLHQHAKRMFDAFCAWEESS